MAKVSAPYNFVPLNKKVFFPPWADWVTHDIPFENGLSGQIELEITAETPIFIRKPYEEGDPEGSYYQNQNGEKVSKEFCHIKDKNGNKRYYIPGSTLRNMLRSVVEIMGFGKLKVKENFTDRRFGVRDFQNTDVYTLLDDTENINIGYLIKKDDKYYIYDKGKPEKIHQEHISYKKKLKNNTVTNNLKDLFDENDQYNSFLKKEKRKDKGYNLLPKFKTAAFKYKETGYVFNCEKDNYVFTGQPNFNSIDKGKKHEFKIAKLDVVNDKKYIVSKQQYNDFKFIYGDYEGSNDISTDWKMWKAKLNKGKGIPVFFRTNENNKIIDFGLSFLYKMAYKNRLEKTIESIQRDYNDPKMDLAETVFGNILDDNKLKGRVTVKHAFSDNAEVEGEYNIVLANPKASYYPFYLTQNLKHNSFKITDKYITLNNDFAEISGKKRYPLHNVNIQDNLAKNNQKNVSTWLKPLQKGAIFNTSLIFHNLLPVELGAILSALTFHNNTNCRHNIGQAKPFGLGQIAIKTKLKNIQLNNKESNDLKQQEYMEIFEKEISKKIHNWIQTEQLVELCTMASINSKKKYQNYDYLDVREFSKIKIEKKALPKFSKMMNYKEKPQSLISNNVNLQLTCEEKISHLISDIDDKIRTIQNKPKQEEYELEEGDYLGIVKFYNEDKGYGFITERITGKDYYINKMGLCDNVIIKQGDFVIFSLYEGRKGEEANKVEIFDKNKHQKQQ